MRQLVSNNIINIIVMNINIIVMNIDIIFININIICSCHVKKVRLKNLITIINHHHCCDKGASEGGEDCQDHRHPGLPNSVHAEQSKIIYHDQLIILILTINDKVAIIIIIVITIITMLSSLWWL